jgi:hypothetical protein
MNLAHQELKYRVEAKKKELEASMAKVKAETAKSSRELKEKIEAKLDSLSEDLKDGWENLSTSAVARINKWLDDEDKAECKGTMN